MELLIFWSVNFRCKLTSAFGIQGFSVMFSCPLGARLNARNADNFVIKSRTTGDYADLV